ncbi:glycosyltransferase family 87 protein [Shinella sp. S4-D37]|uniref:glycosyltransferase family 87 protein n=1 Tax=Shinella sp. S4-D37 TaxID=3161999 RepID=UPI003466BA94
MKRVADPFLAVFILAAIAGAIAIMAVALEPGAPSLRWTDKDFANYWVAAGLALEGRIGEVFGPQAAYLAHMRSLFGADYPWHAWSYPPHYLLLMLPLGLLPYKAALLSFVTATFLFLCAAARLACPRPRWWQLLLLLPPILTNGIATQNGFLLSALMLAGLALRDRRPIVAGLCFGLLTVKPQLGVLLPLLLLWERQWVVIASASFTALALVALSAAVFGVEAWTGYIDQIIPYQTAVMREAEGIFLHMMPTVYGSVRSLGGDAASAFTAHLPFAVAMLALYGASLPRLARPDMRAASTLFATTLAVPYLLNYDLVALIIAAVLWTERGPLHPSWRRTLIGLSLIAMIMPGLGLLGWPVAPAVILAAWLGLLYRADGLPRPAGRRDAGGPTLRT